MRGATLAVLCSNRHAPVLQRCIDSVVRRPNEAPMVDEIVVGFEGKPTNGLPSRLGRAHYIGGWLDCPTITVPDGVEVWVVPIGTAHNLRDAWGQVFLAASREWVLFLDADDVVASRESPKGALVESMRDIAGDRWIEPIGGSLATTMEAWASHNAGSLVDSAWVPYDFEYEDDWARDRRVVRRIVRRGEGWLWGPSPTRVDLFRADEERRVAMVNMLVCRQPLAEKGDALGASRRLTTLLENKAEAAWWFLEVGEELVRLARYREAVGHFTTAVRLASEGRGRGSTAMILRAGWLAHRTACDRGRDIDLPPCVLSEMRRVAEPSNPIVHRVDLLLAYRNQNWSAVREAFFAWRRAEGVCGWARLRYWDDPVVRKTEPYAAGVEALLHLGQRDLAIKIAEEANVLVPSPALAHMLEVARAHA